MSIDNLKKTAVIAGAGPAGLTAALELLRRSDITPLVFEADSQVGGISKTVNYRGNRIDLGGHRFFSKSDWVMRWWQEILPVAGGQTDSDHARRITYRQQSREWLPTGNGPASSDSVMLVRRRLSRIFHRRRFFDYPLTLNTKTLVNLGILETLRVGLSYGHAQFMQRTPETSLEDFLVNRFGNRLYRTFFKDYTEKVWGVPCREISSAWGAQRIKGLSVAKAVANAFTRPFRSAFDTSQKQIGTSLIERFLYPKLGPGQMWESVAHQITRQGGSIHLGHRVVGLEHDGHKINAVTIEERATGVLQRVRCDFFVSTMPVRDLAEMLEPDDSDVLRIAQRLPYRDFMTAGLLLGRMKDYRHQSEQRGDNGMPPDNWIYIQEPDVSVGRLQVFNNWSPAMVANPATIWLGLEYFCRQGDELWSMGNAQFVDFAAGELEKIGMIDRKDVLDGTVIRVPDAYPAYFGEYREFGRVRAYLERFSNLYPVGRNGMHRYNNQDHSMLAANGAVNAIIGSGHGKSAIWDINVDDEYQEEIGEA